MIVYDTAILKAYMNDNKNILPEKQVNYSDLNKAVIFSNNTPFTFNVNIGGQENIIPAFCRNAINLENRGRSGTILINHIDTAPSNLYTCNTPFFTYIITDAETAPVITPYSFFPAYNNQQGGLI